MAVSLLQRVSEIIYAFGGLWMIESKGDLAEVGSAAQLVEGGVHFLESKHAVDHRPHLVMRDGPVHRFEHFAIAHGDALYTEALHEDRDKARVGAVPTEHSDDADGSSGLHRAQRACDRTRAAYLDDVIDADAVSEALGF